MALAKQLEDEREARRDYIAPLRSVKFDGENNQLTLADQFRTSGSFDIMDHTHSQIGSWAKIPAAYYRRMREEAPALLSENVNHWMEGEGDKKRLVRTLNGKARAFLSDRYNPFDNYEVAERALASFQDADVEIVSAEVTEKRFYLKAVSRKIKAEVAVGDVCQSGIVISNSEVGLGSLRVEPLIYRLFCLNGMIAPDAAFKRAHIGGALGDGSDSLVEFYSEDTRRKSDELVYSQIGDIVSQVMSDSGFSKIMERFARARGQKLEGDSFEVVEWVQKKYALTEGEGKGVLESLLRDATSHDTLFGLVNAVTDYSKRVDDYDRATEIERVGGKILEAELV